MPLVNPLRLFAVAAAAVVGSLPIGGCNVAGFAAQALPPPTVEAAYQDLAGQSVAIVLWASPEIDVDYPALTRQIGRRLEDYLKGARDSGNRTTRESLAGMTFPLPSDSFVKAFRNDPSLASATPKEIASLAGADRVVYIELNSFTTGGGAAAGLVRGLAQANLAVYEVADPITTEAEASLAAKRGQSGSVVEGYREDGITFVYPPKGPAEGSNRLTPEAAYSGLTLAIADGIAQRLVEHRQEQ